MFCQTADCCIIYFVKFCFLSLRSPFSGQPDYTDKKSELLRLSIEMATSGQRDRFAESPLLAIRESCKKLATLADFIIQVIFV